MAGDEPLRQFGPDLDDDKALAPVDEPSLLEALAQEAERHVEDELEPITLETPGREGWAVRYATDVSVAQVEAWEKQAADRQMPNGIDNLKHASLVLANQCEAILKDGAVLRDHDGENVTFRSPFFHEKFGVQRSVDAVLAWFAVDGPIMTQAQEVLVASGFGQGATRAVDPTNRSQRRSKKTRG